MLTAITPPVDGISRMDEEVKHETDDLLKKTSSIISRSSLHQMDLEPDNAAEIEALEQSLTALVDDFRSGKMCALGEGKLKMMRKAREEMEDLTAFHVKLHKRQAPNFSTFSDDDGLDGQYDLLFQRLNKLHCFLHDMSFGTADVKEESDMLDITVQGKAMEMLD
uniref:Uncharacterized protein n=1 Tax=Setaria digitata TaxID=48799 RepID=A0A915PUG0_9BILA